MALAAEQVFFAAVNAADGVRQNSRAAALTTYGFDPTKAVAYVTALSDADAVYITAVNAASDTSNLLTGTVGHAGPLPWSVSANIVK
jgi:hypothetical protein